jgi:acetate---CoA ligase (ADP-forming)
LFFCFPQISQINADVKHSIISEKKSAIISVISGQNFSQWAQQPEQANDFCYWLQNSNNFVSDKAMTYFCRIIYPTMISNKLIDPRSIVVVGGSNDVSKPGGKVLKNIMDGGFTGSLYVTNPKEDEVQGIPCFRDPAGLPEVDLAIIAIAARFVPDVVELLAKKKNTRAFIVISAGFSEESMEGTLLEQRLVNIVDAVGGTLIGPNCIGVLTPYHQSVFTYPIPELDPSGCDFISGSGATACFIMEAGIPNGLRFASVYSVGNSAQTGVEEVLQYMDETYDSATSSHVKILYIETISKPQKLLKHAASLIRKGCRIAAIKAGSSDAGSRAATSHTGALAGSDLAVDALFRKAGIVRCHSREELVTVASVFMHPELKGKNLAVITHAGGPAVMLTDALSNGGMSVPHIESLVAWELLDKLHPGSSVANPIDFLATGTAEQLGVIIDFVDRHFDQIDGMVVIFGTPGLFPVDDVYTVLDQKMRSCKKPVYPVLPSVVTASDEVERFIAKGRINFPDEVNLGKALARVYHTPPPTLEKVSPILINNERIRDVIDRNDDGYLLPSDVQTLLDAAGIPRADEAVCTSIEDAAAEARRLGFPIAMKVVGPVHKSDVGGVVLNIADDKQLRMEFERMIRIPDTTAVLLQPMLSGTELFAGAKLEKPFGHMILCGMGGIYIEVLKDVAHALSPVSHHEAQSMIRSLRSYKIFKGMRGHEGINEDVFADVLVRLSALVACAPEILEMDLNPLMAKNNQVIAVDARINLKK